MPASCSRIKQYMIRACSRCSVARVYDYGRCNKWVTVGLKETRFAQMAMVAIKKVVR